MLGRLRRARPGLVLSAGLLAAAPAARGDPFADCARQFEARPDDYASSYCFFQVAQREKRWEDAARRLDRLRELHPGNAWVLLARGNVEWTRDVDRAESFYREAVAGFAAQGLAEGEVLARTNLRTLHNRKGRLDEAGREVERALTVAEASGEELVLARALALQAQHLIDTGDLVAACRSLHRAEEAAFPAGPYTLRRTIVFALGHASFRLGRFDDAIEYYRRVDAMTEEAQDGLSRASARYNVANTLFRQMEELPRPGGREELLGLARDALLTAEAADNREIQALLHRTLGELLAARPETRGEGRGHYEACIRVAGAIGQPRELAHCLWSLAGAEAEDGRTREAQRRIGEALALVRKTGHAWSLAYACRQRMRVAWGTRPRAEAVRESMESLDALESFRRLQEDAIGSAAAFSAWASDYHWLAGRLLVGRAGAPGREDMEQAFGVVERMRARVLLDAMGAARIAPDLHSMGTERRARLQEIADVHRDLLDPAAAGGRSELEARLATLEAEEAKRGDADGLPRFATLPEVERALGPREAMLSFHVGLDRDVMGEPAGGAWVTVVTSAGTTAHRVPDRVRLHSAVPVFLGLFARRDGREAAASAILFRELLAPALADLDPAVERLIVVPDDLLHRVPFAALRASAEAAPLGARFEIAIAPSATLWLRWRQAAHADRPRALVLADPAPPAVRALSSEELSPLPLAREEGRLVARRLARTTLWVGEAAAEDALKQTRLDAYGLLHFAAHAIANEEQPDRSSVLLAPGRGVEDGLLQGREIAALPLEGRVVVLSACRTAGGSLLRGEGVLSLARAFFQAGAPVVVGSLWPLRDDEAADLFAAFYDELGRGAPVAAALRAAQRDAIASGRPAAAWAGLVVMGDGGRVPFPGGVARSPSSLLVAGGALVGVLSLWALRRRLRG